MRYRRHRSGYIPARSSLVNRMSCVRSIRIPIILPEEHHDAWLSYEAGKEVLVCLDSGRSRKKNRTSSKKVWSNRVIFIVTTVLRRMRKSKNASTISPIKPEIRTWYAFEGPLGDVIHDKRFFFAWKEGCLMGTYNTLEEATASLTSRETRETH